MILSHLVPKTLALLFLLTACGTSTDSLMSKRIEAMQDRLEVVTAIGDEASAAAAIPGIRRSLAEQSSAESQLTEGRLAEVSQSRYEDWGAQASHLNNQLGEWFGFELRVNPSRIRALEEVLSPGALRALERREAATDAELEDMGPELMNLMLDQPDHQGTSTFFKE